jgi:transcriptional regulator with XRE-family HTH domain
MTERDRELIAFGLTIRRAREEKGMSPDVLAAAAGVERERLDAIEAGRFEPAVDVLLALADGLGVGLAVLVRRAGALKVEGGTPPPLPAADEHSLTSGGRPPIVLRERLAAARQAGASFDKAWPGALMDAVNAVQWERTEWLEVLSELVDAWRAGWERTPATRPERALAMLALPGGAPLPERACEHCGAEIPPERDRRARFCSDDCRRQANYQRERTAA